MCKHVITAASYLLLTIFYIYIFHLWSCCRPSIRASPTRGKWGNNVKQSIIFIHPLYHTTEEKMPIQDKKTIISIPLIQPQLVDWKSFHFISRHKDTQYPQPTIGNNSETIQIQKNRRKWRSHTNHYQTYKNSSFLVSAREFDRIQVQIIFYI